MMISLFVALHKQEHGKCRDFLDLIALLQNLCGIAYTCRSNRLLACGSERSCRAMTGMRKGRELRNASGRICFMGKLARCSLMGTLFVQGLFSQQSAATFGTTVVILAGLRGSVYLIPKNTTVLPDFERDPVQRVGEVWTNELNIQPRHWRAGFPGLTERFEWFAIDYSGRFWVADPGRYTFALLSDDGSRLFLDDTPVIDNDCQHPPDLRIAAVQLAGGGHRIRVSYFQGPRDCLALVLAVAGPDQRWKLFNVREFKPPSNPEDWHFPIASSLVLVAATPEEAALTMNGLAERLSGGDPTERFWVRSKTDRGCREPAVRVCGQ